MFVKFCVFPVIFHHVLKFILCSVFTETWPDPVCARLRSPSKDSPRPVCCYGSRRTTDHV